MAYTPRTRDRYRLGVSVATGATAVAALAATGWMMGASAHDYEQENAERLQQQRAAAAAAAREQAEYRAAVAAAKPASVVARQRPQRVRVITRYVRAATVAAPSSGGTLRAPVSSSAGSGGTPTPAAPAPAAAPQTPAPPPPPPPAPAPSSGS